MMVFLAVTIQLSATDPYMNSKRYSKQFELYNEQGLNFSKVHFEFNSIQKDSTNFKYRNLKEKKGLKPFIIPSILITTGTALHFANNVKENVRDFSQDHLKYKGNLDDYLQFAPMAAVYGLQAFGVSGKNNFGNSTAILIKTVLLRDFIVTTLKRTTGVKRPSGGNHSFPSGHTSFAFSVAHFMHREFGHRSAWYSVAAYSSAAAVGYMRVARNAHWISDVIAGAGIGMLCTELVYLTHLYKWDNEHLKNFDIFPFSTRKQKGLTLVYHF